MMYDAITCINHNFGGRRFSKISLKALTLNNDNIYVNFCLSVFQDWISKFLLNIIAICVTL